MTNANELKAECVRSGLTLEALATAIGISYTSLYRKINGDSEFSRQELEGIRNVLKLSDIKFMYIFFS